MDVSGTGGIVRDPEFKYSDKGHPMWRGTVVESKVSYIPADGRDGIVKTYVSCIAFGQVAEDAAELALTPGCEVKITGELTQYELTDGEGKKERKTQVKLHTIDLLRRPSSAQANAELPPGC